MMPLFRGDMPTKRNLRLLLSVFALLSAGAGGSALADVKQECSSAYDDVQSLRKQGKLRAAHEKGVACAQDQCTTSIRNDCANWVGEIEAIQPTLVFAATASGDDTTQVRVLLDGAVIQASLDGKEVAVDPGPHKLRFEFAGTEPIEQPITVNTGEKRRKVPVAFGKPKIVAPPAPSVAPISPPPASAPVATGAPPPTQPVPPSSPEGSTQRTLGVVGIAVGVVGLGLGAVTGAIAVSKHSNLGQECSATCPASAQSDRDSYYTMGALSTVGFIVAGIGAGGGILLLATAPKSKAASSGRISPWFGVGSVGMTGSF